MLKAHLGHVTLYADNPDLLGAFYRDLFGMEIVGRAPTGSSIFLGGRPQEEKHEVTFIHNRKAAHLGLKVASLADLLASYQEVKARGLKMGPLYKHGFALSLFFQDPEGNLLEAHWPMGREDVAPPVFTPLELDDPPGESAAGRIASLVGVSGQSFLERLAEDPDRMCRKAEVNQVDASRA